MQENPYAAPTAAVEDIATHDSDSSGAPWFPVSIPKLLVMSFCTMGLYQVYWFYENWKRIKQRESLDIYPVLRAIFTVFFCYQLFTKIRDFDSREQQASLAAGPLAAGWIVSTLLWRLPDPYWWIAIAAFFFLLPVQAQANTTNAVVAPRHNPNSRLSALNWVAVVFGGLLLLAAVLGTVFPE